MSDLLDLEISLYRAPGDQYRVQTRLMNPYDEVVPDPVTATLALPEKELEECRALSDWAAYGRVLADFVFRDAGAAPLYVEAVRLAGVKQTAVRLRLLIDEGATPLHNLIWEAILDPQRTDLTSPAWLSAARDVYFSRFLTGGRVCQFSLRQKFQLRALVFISNPKPPVGLTMDSIDVENVRACALRGLAGIAGTVVASSDQTPGQATLDNLIHLLDRAYDIVYIVCHGVFDRSEPRDALLYLEDSKGVLDRVTGKQLVAEVQRLHAPPNLVILASCESAGDPSTPARANDGALASLGPRLIRAGVPAVVAMQGKLRMETADVFLPSLMGSLQKNGTIDSAVSEARGKIARAPDFYVPVLFQRLRSGRIWYGEEEARADDDSIRWGPLLDEIIAGDGTAILGSGLLEPYVGSQAELAARLAKRFGYAFAEKNRDDIALVTQYISALRSPAILSRAVGRELALQVLRHYGEVTPQLLRGMTLEQRLAQDAGLENEVGSLIETVWRSRCAADSLEPHQLLVRMPFKAYISTNPDSLLELAFQDYARTNKNNQRHPIVWHCGKDGTNVRLAAGTPNIDHPLLAYVYGTLSQPDTLVLTEQDYYHHLINSATSGAASVRELNRIFVNSSLIFLGFRLHEWDFRIFFRGLTELAGWQMHLRHRHVAVQIDPSSSGGLASIGEVRDFLRQLLGPNIEIFEGSVEQFVQSLSRRLAARAAVPLSIGGGM